MRIALLSAGTGWHVRDLQRAATLLNHEAVAVDFRRIYAGVEIEAGSLAHFDAVLVRTMPPGSLEQVIFRMDALHRLHDTGITVLNPPRAVEICVDKYLTAPVSPPRVCRCLRPLFASTRMRPSKPSPLWVAISFSSRCSAPKGVA